MAARAHPETLDHLVAGWVVLSPASSAPPVDPRIMADQPRQSIEIDTGLQQVSTWQSPKLNALRAVLTNEAPGLPELPRPGIPAQPRADPAPDSPKQLGYNHRGPEVDKGRGKKAIMNPNAPLNEAFPAYVYAPSKVNLLIRSSSNEGPPSRLDYDFIGQAFVSNEEQPDTPENTVTGTPNQIGGPKAPASEDKQIIYILK